MFNLDTKELINKINTNSLEFWNEFRKLPSDFDLELSYLQAMYVTKTVVPLDCQERCIQIYNKIEDLISYKELDIAERENLITKGLQGKRNVYNFINIKSYNHYIFVNIFDDLPKELAYFINRVSIDVLKNMNLKHYQEFRQILVTMGFSYLDACKLSLQIYHVFGYFKGRDFLTGKYGSITKGKIKSIFASIDLSEVVYDVNSHAPKLNETIIKLLLGESYHVEGTPIKKYLEGSANDDIVYFVENLNLIINNWDLITIEYTRRANLEKLNLRLNVGQVRSILENIIGTNREIKRKESFRLQKKARYNKIPDFKLQDMPLLDSDLFDYIGTVNKYVTRPSEVAKRGVELSRMIEDACTKKIPNVQVQEDGYKLFVFHPQDRDLISAGFRISCCFVPTGEADNYGENPSLLEYALTSPYGGGIEIRDVDGNTIMFSPILRNGNTIIIYSIQYANYTKKEIKIVTEMLKKWGREVIENSKQVEGDKGIVAVTVTNRGNIPQEEFPIYLPLDKKFHIYDPEGKFAKKTFNDLKYDNVVVALKDVASIEDIKYDEEVISDYNYPLSDLKINHQVVEMDEQELSIVKEMLDLEEMIDNYTSMRKDNLKNQPVLAMELLREIKRLRSKFNAKYQELFKVSSVMRVDKYKRYNDAIDTIKEICRETNTNIDFNITLLKKIYFTDSWFIAIDLNDELHYECITGAEYQFLVVLDDVKKQQLALGGGR